MKTIITLIALAALTACGDICIDPVASPQTDVVVTAPVVVVEPSPVVPPPALTTEPIFCPQSTGCPSSPYPAPRPPTVIGEPIFICIRNSDPLVLIDGVLTDNCGNHYGTVTI